MKSKKIKIPIYNGTLVIYQTKDLKDVEIKHDLTDCSGCDAITFQLNKKNGYGVFYMAFEKKPTASIIAHESVHIKNKIFNHCHVELDINNDEPEAYLLDWIVEQCHKFLIIKK